MVAMGDSMKFIRSMLILGLVAGSAQSALAMMVQINNVSGKTISAIFATPKDEATPSTTNAYESGQLSVTSENSQCVFTLAIEFSDSTNLELPDVDLCQTETLMVE